MFVVYYDCEKLRKKIWSIPQVCSKDVIRYKISRPDTGTDISYLTKRLMDTDQRDLDEYSTFIKYVRGTKYLPLILSADKSVILKWYIDISHSVHPNIRERIGVGLTMGWELPILVSSK